MLAPTENSSGVSNVCGLGVISSSSHLYWKSLFGSTADTILGSPHTKSTPLGLQIWTVLLFSIGASETNGVENCKGYHYHVQYYHHHHHHHNHHHITFIIIIFIIITFIIIIFIIIFIIIIIIIIISSSSSRSTGLNIGACPIAPGK